MQALQHGFQHHGELTHIPSGAKPIGETRKIIYSGDARAVDERRETGGTNNRSQPINRRGKWRGLPWSSYQWGTNRRTSGVCRSGHGAGRQRFSVYTREERTEGSQSTAAGTGVW